MEMESIADRALRWAKEQKALVVLTVDPEGLWTMVPISMQLVDDYPDWGREWARLWRDSVDEAREARDT